VILIACYINMRYQNTLFFNCWVLKRLLFTAQFSFNRLYFDKFYCLHINQQTFALRRILISIMLLLRKF